MTDIVIDICPTCGGLCTATTEPDYDRDYIHGYATGPRRLYESLVKGKVAVEGWRECAEANGITTLGNEYFRVYKGRPSIYAVRVLVFKAKESQHDRRHGMNLEPGLRDALHEIQLLLRDILAEAMKTNKNLEAARKAKETGGKERDANNL